MSRHILEQIRRHLEDEVAVLDSKIKYADRVAPIYLETLKARLKVKRGFASNLERIIGKMQ